MARGRKEFMTHLSGKPLTLKQAVLAKCYDCMAGYTDGKVDCGIMNCPLYQWMPYRPKNRPSNVQKTP